MLALSVLGLQPKTALVTGSVQLDGTELIGGSPAQWQRIRGDRVAMVFQDPMTALNPMYTIGWQVAECVRLHRQVEPRRRRLAARSSCWPRSACPSRADRPAGTRTSCPAACASGS